MSKKLQYSDVVRNIIIYEHNSLLKIPTIFFLHLIITSKKWYKSK
jgi:hypothetical protein